MCHFVVVCVEEETKRRKKPILKLFFAKPKKRGKRENAQSINHFDISKL